MKYYKIHEKVCFSNEKIEYPEISKEAFEKEEGTIYFIYKKPLKKSREGFILSTHEQIFTHNTIDELFIEGQSVEVSDYIQQKIEKREVIALNYPLIQKLEEISMDKEKYSLTILGLGDVGSTLLIGLRLLGKDVVDEIRIFDLNEDKVKRWVLEANQIVYPEDFSLPEVKGCTMEELFDTDVFIFTASKFIPKVGEDAKDVRMVQFEENAKIVRYYAKMAREKNFKGIFAVVSDPVDLLCNVVYEQSNKNEKDEFDAKGLLPNQVRGFGLGVMNARANYYSDVYSQSGRVYGPHGKDLIVANSIEAYDSEKSLVLTKKVVEANLKVREVGYKPYIAPAMSSGAISILETIRGRWNYSTVFIDGVYWGVKNKYVNGLVEIETSMLPEKLKTRIKESYERLFTIYEQNKNISF